jgi:hypothetical protein
MNSDSKKQTVTELATEYMQAYYSEKSLSGEDSSKAQAYKACWDLFKEASRRLSYSKDLEVKANSKKQLTLKDVCTSFVQMLLDKFKGIKRRSK